MTSRKRKTTDEPIPIHELPLKEPFDAHNRRFMPRVNCSFSVSADEIASRMRGLDISFGGLMCVSDTPVWPGNSIDFTIDLPDIDRSLPAQGKVVELVSYKDEVAMRIRFEDIEEEHRATLAEWMARRQFPI